MYIHTFNVRMIISISIWIICSNIDRKRDPIIMVIDNFYTVVDVRDSITIFAASCVFFGCVVRGCAHIIILIFIFIRHRHYRL